MNSKGQEGNDPLAASREELVICKDRKQKVDARNSESSNAESIRLIF
jgi:hypothetical protein